jgi:hypothetical protein
MTNQWLHAIVKGDQIGFNTISDRLDAELFKTFLNNMLNQNLIMMSSKKLLIKQRL